eukprot:336240-Pelagomonas_calceolata.AAC.2
MCWPLGLKGQHSTASGKLELCPCKPWVAACASLSIPPLYDHIPLFGPRKPLVPVAAHIASVHIWIYPGRFFLLSVQDQHAPAPCCAPVQGRGRGGAAARRAAPRKKAKQASPEVFEINRCGCTGAGDPSCTGAGAKQAHKAVGLHLLPCTLCRCGCRTYSTSVHCAR